MLQSPFPRVARWPAAWLAGVIAASLLLVAEPRALDPTGSVQAQADSPAMLDANLGIRAMVTGLTTPTSMAFLGPNDVLVLEKTTGRVQRVSDGTIRGTVLDLAVNFASERGLLGMALHPDFPTNPGVYLFWTESMTGEDTNALGEVPLLGNRVDRFLWDGATLTLDRNILRLRSLQEDEGQPLRGNHDGGVLRFGPDRKLYVFFGDVGRRGQLQNLAGGPSGNGEPDDQFGGPEPDDAHLSGVVLRLEDDGAAPPDNPFYGYGAEVGGQDGANLQKVFSYGHRNSFGMAFDPIAGHLWLQENGDDSFSELNRVEPGMNGGWIQIAGPADHVGEFKEIETRDGQDPVAGSTYFGLQQLRWPPTLIADTTEEALSSLVMFPGAHYADPALSWRYELAPGGIGFLTGQGLGAEYESNLFLGAGSPLLAGGYLFRVKLTADRRAVAVDDPRLEDRVADNETKYGPAESESLLIGTDFGVGTWVQTGPNGNLFVVSLTRGAIYEIYRLP